MPTPLLGASELSATPVALLIGLGVLVGIAGHVYESKTAIAAGIAMIFIATLLLPLGLYLSDR